MTRRLRDIGEHGWIARLLRTVPSGPRVLVGRMAPGSASRQANCRALPQPFDFGELIDAINAAVETPLNA